MSHEAVTWVLNFANCGGNAKVILLGIASHADKYGEEAWPSVDTLARYVNLDRRATQRWLRRLEDDGLIETSVQGALKRRPDRATNSYRIVGVRSWVSQSIDGAVREPPRGNRGAVGETPRGGSADTRGAVGEPRESSIEPSIEPSLTLLPAAPSESLAVAAAFGAFWTAYPKHRQIEKAKTGALFAKAVKTTDDAVAIMEGLARWVKYWEERSEPQFVPWPRKWLDRRQWETEPPPMSGPKRGNVPAADRPRNRIITDRTGGDRIREKL